ncbi:hypothetical protein COB55_02860 [Candidatus Wolfebacteria bacterium]|nr:MAG: hypothetical protein COB55_02860 [Candidatus Wolfebacteria bacterium]
MVVETWSEVLAISFQNLWAGVIAFLPNLVVAIIIFILGWIVGVLLGRIVAQIIKALKVDNALRGAGLEDLLSRGNFALDTGRFVGALVKWFVIIAFLVASLDVLGLNEVNVFLREVVLGYLPQVFIAVFIILVGAVIADALQRVVVGAAKAAEISSANFLGALTRWSIWVFAVLAALFQLGVAGPFVQTFFTGVVIAVSLAVGLAFGLGGQEHAGKWLSSIEKEIKSR